VWVLFLAFLVLVQVLVLVSVLVLVLLQCLQAPPLHPAAQALPPRPWSPAASP
jgi:hypothetical protein